MFPRNIAKPYITQGIKEKFFCSENPESFYEYFHTAEKTTQFDWEGRGDIPRAG